MHTKMWDKEIPQKEENLILHTCWCVSGQNKTNFLGNSGNLNQFVNSKLRFSKCDTWIKIYIHFLHHGACLRMMNCTTFYSTEM